MNHDDSWNVWFDAICVHVGSDLLRYLGQNFFGELDATFHLIVREEHAVRDKLHNVTFRLDALNLIFIQRECVERNSVGETF